jgi:hypothetical protein
MVVCPTIQVPQPLRHRPQVDTHTADDHQQQTARGKSILTGQHASYKFQHILAFLTGSGPEL